MSAIKEITHPIVLTLTETVDAARLNTLMQLESVFDDSSWHYLLHLYQNNYTVEVNYRASKNVTDATEGRIYPDPTGAIYLKKIYRSYLFGATCDDWDFKLCFGGLFVKSMLDRGYGGAIPETIKWVKYFIAGNIAVACYGANSYAKFKKLIYCELFDDNSTNIAPTGEFAEVVKEMRNNRNVFGQTGSIRALQFQKLERELVLNVINQVKDGVVSYCYDGLIVKQSFNLRMTEIANKLNAQCEFIQLVHKPWSATTSLQFVPINSWQDASDIDYLHNHSGSIYSSCADALNKLRVALIKNVRSVGSQYLVRSPGNDFELIKNIKQYLNFRVFYLTGKKDKKSQMYLDDICCIFGRLIYCKALTSFPTAEPDMFSTFKGLRVAKIAPLTANEDGLALTRLIRNHIYEVLCDSDEPSYAFVITWLARVVREFPTQTEKMLLFNGDEGTGKTTIKRLLMDKLMGRDMCCSMSGCDDLTKNDNFHLFGKVLVVLEEIKSESQKEVRHDLDRIKYLIDSGTMDFKKLYCDKFTDTNALNLLGFTNYEHALRGVQGINRRVAMFETNAKYKGNTEYFNNLYTSIDNDRSVRAFYEYLLAWDLVKHTLEIIPETKAKTENQFFYADYVQKTVWLLRHEIEYKGQEFIRLTSNDFIRQIKRFELYGGDKAPSALSIGKKVIKILPDFRLDKSRIKLYTVDMAVEIPAKFKDAVTDYYTEMVLQKEAPLI